MPSSTFKVIFSSSVFPVAFPLGKYVTIHSINYPAFIESFSGLILNMLFSDKFH